MKNDHLLNYPTWWGNLENNGLPAPIVGEFYQPKDVEIWKSTTVLVNGKVKHVVLGHAVHEEKNSDTFLDGGSIHPLLTFPIPRLDYLYIGWATNTILLVEGSVDAILENLEELRKYSHLRHHPMLYWHTAVAVVGNYSRNRIFRFLTRRDFEDMEAGKYLPMEVLFSMSACIDYKLSAHPNVPKILFGPGRPALSDITLLTKVIKIFASLHQQYVEDEDE